MDRKKVHKKATEIVTAISVSHSKNKKLDKYADRIVDLVQSEVNIMQDELRRLFKIDADKVYTVEQPDADTVVLKRSGGIQEIKK